MDAGPINAIFDLLDRWRHLPNYQLERRADIFIALHLPQFLSDHLGVPINPTLIPEFPVHIGTIQPDCDINRSFKIDYLAVAQDRSRVFFVELKTDGLSRREEQDTYLAASAQCGLPKLLHGLIQIACATRTAKRKYIHLFLQLQSAGLLELPPSLAPRLTAKHLRGVDEDFRHTRVTLDTCAARTLYLQPIAGTDADDEIGFAELATWLERLDDPLTCRLRSSLRAWSTTAAGNMQDGL